jgi:hypothetical protein
MCGIVNLMWVYRQCLAGMKSAKVHVYEKLNRSWLKATGKSLSRMLQRVCRVEGKTEATLPAPADALAPPAEADAAAEALPPLLLPPQLFQPPHNSLR